MISTIIAIFSFLVAAYAVYLNIKTINNKDSNSIELIRIKLMRYVPKIYTLYCSIYQLNEHNESFKINDYGASVLKNSLQDNSIKLEDFVHIAELAEYYYKHLIEINKDQKNLPENFYDADLIYITHTAILKFLDNTLFIKEYIINNNNFNAEYIKNINLEQALSILFTIENCYTLLYAYTILLDNKSNIWWWFIVKNKKRLIDKINFKSSALESNIQGKNMYSAWLLSFKNWLNKKVKYKINTQDKYKKGLNDLTNIKEIRFIATTISDIPKNYPLTEDYELQLRKAIEKINQEIF